MFEKVKYCIDNKLSPKKYINSLDNNINKEQLTEIFKTLIQEKLIKKHEDEDFKVILDKIFKMDIDTLILTGAEPLIRQDIKSLLKYIRSNFKGTVNNLKNAGFNKETINFTMVATKQNSNHSADFHALYEKLGVTGAIRQFSALGRGLENYM